MGLELIKMSHTGPWDWKGRAGEEGGRAGGNRENNTCFLFFSLYGRWEDLDRWKWVVIDV